MNCLFENYEDQPKELRKITDKYTEIFNDRGLGDGEIDNFLKEVEEIGYTFDYGLDLEPYDLRVSDAISIKASDFDEEEINKPF